MISTLGTQGRSGAGARIIALKKGHARKRWFKMSKNRAIVLGMAFIMFVSMAGYMVSSLIEDEEAVEGPSARTAVTIDFGNYTRVNKILNISTEETAYDLFNKLGTVTLDFVENSFVVTKVATENRTETARDEFVWVFYVNGVINFNPVDEYKPRNGDMMELRLEKNPY